jgi:hypothetical protein
VNVRGWHVLRILIGLLALTCAPAAEAVVSSPAVGALTATISVNSTAATGGSAANCVSGTGICTMGDAFGAASLGGGDAGQDVTVKVSGAVGTLAVSPATLSYDGGTGGNHVLTINGDGYALTQATTAANDISLSSGAGLVVNGLRLSGGHTGIAGGAGPITITNSVITDNHGGGGIVSSGTITITNSTISGNSTVGPGGGIDSGASSLTIVNSTITGNTATTVGGGVFAPAGLTSIYTTINGNSAPVGANVDGSTTGALVSFGSVFASPAGGGTNCADLSGMTSHGFNDEDDAAATCGFSTATADLAPGTAPHLGALANNGGPTPTELPQPGSPLIDAIPVPDCGAGVGIGTDQRGVVRPQGPGCDVGAVEVQQQTAAPVLITAAFTG